MPRHVPHSPHANAFSCPYDDCGAYAQQSWKFVKFVPGERFLTAEESAARMEKLRKNAEKRSAQISAASAGVSSAVVSAAGARKAPAIEHLLDSEPDISEFSKLAGLRPDPFPYASGNPLASAKGVHSLRLSECANCGRLAVWVEEHLVWPKVASSVEPPHEDMPADAASDYREAATILDASPRGAAALNRLALQKICGFLGYEGKKINTAIGELVKEGLPADVQEQMDAIRMIGDSAVHPLELDLRDDLETASAGFWLLNEVVEQTIAKPKRAKALWAKMPERARQHAADRDKKARAAAADATPEPKDGG